MLSTKMGLRHPRALYPDQLSGILPAYKIGVMGSSMTGIIINEFAVRPDVLSRTVAHSVRDRLERMRLRSNL